MATTIVASVIQIAAAKTNYIIVMNALDFKDWIGLKND